MFAARISRLQSINFLHKEAATSGVQASHLRPAIEGGERRRAKALITCILPATRDSDACGDSASKVCVSHRGRHCGVEDRKRYAHAMKYQHAFSRFGTDFQRSKQARAARTISLRLQFATVVHTGVTGSFKSVNGQIHSMESSRTHWHRARAKNPANPIHTCIPHGCHSVYTASVLDGRRGHLLQRGL